MLSLCKKCVQSNRDNGKIIHSCEFEVFQNVKKKIPINNSIKSKIISNLTEIEFSQLYKSTYGVTFYINGHIEVDASVNQKRFTLNVNKERKVYF